MTCWQLCILVGEMKSQIDHLLDYYLCASVLPQPKRLIQGQDVQVYLENRSQGADALSAEGLNLCYRDKGSPSGFHTVHCWSPGDSPLAWLVWEKERQSFLSVSNSVSQGVCAMGLRQLILNTAIRAQKGECGAGRVVTLCNPKGIKYVSKAQHFSAINGSI